jgi:hypothetical protein
MTLNMYTFRCKWLNTRGYVFAPRRLHSIAHPGHGSDLAGPETSVATAWNAISWQTEKAFQVLWKPP